jgi:hypothetical protein
MDERDQLLSDQFEQTWVADPEVIVQARNNTLENFRLVFGNRFRFHEGSVYTRLGATRLAFRAHERALEVCPPGDYTDWALTRLDRARCLAHDGDLVAAATYATETLTRLSGEQTQGIIAVRGHELIRALPPRYRAVPAVREMQELLLQER